MGGPQASSVLGTPLERAPNNVFLRDDDVSQKSWTNVFHVPVEYSVEMHAALLHPDNPTLATRFMAHTLPKRRFIVLDQAVQHHYGPQIDRYFAFHSVRTEIVVIPGEEQNKTIQPVNLIFERLCEFGLHRREPILAIGGGVVLDIVGFVASMYRRGVPYIRVPTTLLAIVDASVGVKTGVDHISESMGPLKNRMGSFHPPIAAFLDKAFIATQDDRNLINGFGEIMKLALVRSTELFALLENHGPRMIKQKFQDSDGVADRILELSIQIMLEELGPNLWEKNLERCVDYGHTFSKVVEMEAVPPLMHGEAVNIDGFCCVLLSHRRGWISQDLRDRILRCMNAMQIPVFDKLCMQHDVMWRALQDALEHRHGKQRVPLITAIGAAKMANDITQLEIDGMIQDLATLFQ